MMRIRWLASSIVVVGALFQIFSGLSRCTVPSLPPPSLSIGASVHQTVEQDNATAKLGDGCFHVFVDVGANVGVHGRFLYEPEKYPESYSSVGLFEEHFGKDRDNRDYCVFEIEPNPVHQARLEQISQAYRAMGWRYHVIHAAASDRNETVTFHHQEVDNENEVAFSVKQLRGTSKTEEVAAFRLADFLRDEILSRNVPEKAGKTPKMLMKLDVEGYEYVVIPDLYLSGVFCQFDLVFGEFHNTFAPMVFQGLEHPLEGRHQIRVFQKGLMGVPSISRNCKTRFRIRDDESYGSDGVPLPVQQEE